jgi:hypothetical protein
VKRLLKPRSDDEPTSLGSERDVPFGEGRLLMMRIRNKIEHVKDVLLRSVIFDFALVELLEAVLRLSERENRSRPDLIRRRKILFTSENIEWRPIRDEETGHTKKSDAFFDSILRRLADRYECVGVYPVLHIYSLRYLLGSVRIVIDKSQSWYVRHRPFELYWSLEARKAENDARRYFKGVSSRLLSDAKFREFCTRA